MMRTLIHERVELARRGENPFVIGRLPSGWAVLGDVQPLRGYSLLLPDPVVGALNELGREQRGRYLLDMAALGDAVLAATGAEHLNYAILGNVEPALHAHVFPRFADEPAAQRRSSPLALLPGAPAADPGGADRPLIEAIRAELRRAGALAP